MLLAFKNNDGVDRQVVTIDTEGEGELTVLSFNREKEKRDSCFSALLRDGAIDATKLLGDSISAKYGAEMVSILKTIPGVIVWGKLWFAPCHLEGEIKSKLGEPLSRRVVVRLFNPEIAAEKGGWKSNNTRFTNWAREERNKD